MGGAGSNSLAVGTNAIATGQGATATGQGAVANAAGTTALGNNASATSANATAVGSGAQASANNSVAVGANSVANEANTVSVGSAGNERRVVNVAPGVNGTDAVNVSQLNAGVTQAINYTNQQVGQLQQSVNNTANRAYSGVAAATALTMIPDVDKDRKFSLGIGAATYIGHAAMAIGGTARLTENIKMRAGVGLSPDGNSVGVGASMQW